MDALAHTPGPWAVEVDPRQDTFTVYEAATNANLNICSVLSAADAALIAAAPAMRLALAEIYQCAHWHVGGDAVIARLAGEAFALSTGVAA